METSRFKSSAHWLQPYRCHLPSKTIQAALNTAVAETAHRLDDWDIKCVVVHCKGPGEAEGAY